MTNTIRQNIFEYLTGVAKRDARLSGLLVSIKEEDKKRKKEDATAVGSADFVAYLATYQGDLADDRPDEQSAETKAPKKSALQKDLTSEDCTQRIRAMTHVLRACALIKVFNGTEFIIDLEEGAPFSPPVIVGLSEDKTPSIAKGGITVIALILSLLRDMQERGDVLSGDVSLADVCDTYLDAILASECDKIKNLSVDDFLPKLTHGRVKGASSPSFLFAANMDRDDVGTNLSRSQDMREHMSSFSFPSEPTIGGPASYLSGVWIVRDIVDSEGVPLVKRLQLYAQDKADGLLSEKGADYAELLTCLDKDADKAAERADALSGIFKKGRHMVSHHLLKQVYVPDTAVGGPDHAYFLVQPCLSDEVWERLRAASERVLAKVDQDIAHGRPTERANFSGGKILSLKIGGSNPQNISTRISSNGNILLSCAPPSHARKSDLLSVYKYRVEPLVKSLAEVFANGGYHNRRRGDRIIKGIAEIFAHIMADNKKYNVLEKAHSPSLIDDVKAIVRAQRASLESLAAGEVLGVERYSELARFTLKLAGLVDSKLANSLSRAMANELRKGGV